MERKVGVGTRVGCVRIVDKDVRVYTTLFANYCLPVLCCAIRSEIKRRGHALIGLDGVIVFAGSIWWIYLDALADWVGMKCEIVRTPTPRIKEQKVLTKLRRGLPRSREIVSH
jgi:hypothetical protein